MGASTLVLLVKFDIRWVLFVPLSFCPVECHKPTSTHNGVPSETIKFSNIDVREEQFTFNLKPCLRKFWIRTALQNFEGIFEIPQGNNKPYLAQIKTTNWTKALNYIRLKWSNSVLLIRRYASSIDFRVKTHYFNQGEVLMFQLSVKGVGLWSGLQLYHVVFCLTILLLYYCPLQVDRSFNLLSTFRNV